jgi:hypothetical protein
VLTGSSDRQGEEVETRMTYVLSRLAVEFDAYDVESEFREKWDGETQREKQQTRNVEFVGIRVAKLSLPYTREHRFWAD